MFPESEQAGSEGTAWTFKGVGVGGVWREEYP